MPTPSSFGNISHFSLTGNFTDYSLTTGGNLKSAEEYAEDLQRSEEHMFKLLVCDSGYEFFGTKTLRRQMHMITSGLIEYALQENAEAIIFADRSARLGRLAFKTLWDKRYEDQLCPEAFFVNPRGFRPTSTDLLDEVMRVYGTSKKNDLLDSPNNRRERDQIISDLKLNHPELLEYVNDPVIFFDTCVHSGDQASHVIDTLKESGFNKLKFAVAYADSLIPGVDIEEASLVVPDKIILSTEPVALCYPFGKDVTTQKTYSSVLSSRRKDLKEHNEMNRRLRLEIIKVILEEDK